MQAYIDKGACLHRSVPAQLGLARRFVYTFISSWSSPHASRIVCGVSGVLSMNQSVLPLSSRAAYLRARGHGAGHRLRAITRWSRGRAVHFLAQHHGNEETKGPTLKYKHKPATRQRKGWEKEAPTYRAFLTAR